MKTLKPSFAGTALVAGAMLFAAASLATPAQAGALNTLSRQLATKAADRAAGCAVAQASFDDAADTIKTQRDSFAAAVERMETTLKAKDFRAFKAADIEAQRVADQMLSTMVKGMTALDRNPQCFDAAKTAEFKAVYAVTFPKTKEFLINSPVYRTK